MRLLRPALASAVLVVLAMVAACQLPLVGGPSEQTPAQGVAAALHALETAHSVRMQGSFTFGDSHFTVNLSMDDESDVDGFILPDRASQVMVVGNSQHLLLKGASHFLQAWSVVTGVRWVQAPDDPLSGLVRTLLKRGELVKAVREAVGSDLERESGKEPDGTRTIRYTGKTSGVSLTVPAAGAPLPLRLVTVPAHPLADNLSDVSLGLVEYGKQVVPEMPQAFVDMADRNTLPVDIVADPNVGFTWDSCDTRGCTMSRGVRNDGGKDGTANVTFTVTRDGAGAQVLATCKVAVPVLANRETTRVGCRANFDPYPSYWGRATIENPLV